MEEERWLGFARRFRPTYALANVGHPSIPYGVARTQTPQGYAVCATLLSTFMRAAPRSMAIAAMTGFLLLGGGCRRAPVETPDAETLSQAVIYPDGAQAAQDIAAAVAQAGKEKKRVLLDFGGNWCGDCKVLQFYFHTPANRSLLEANYVVVPVNIGQYDENLDIAARYGIPLARGVPALAVLDSNGQLVYSQRNAEFEAMGKVDPAAVTAFLLQWKG
jgi:thioredoxin 1